MTSGQSCITRYQGHLCTCNAFVHWTETVFMPAWPSSKWWVPHTIFHSEVCSCGAQL